MRIEKPFAEAVAASPKLDHFPSQQPLSEQEKMLLDYVNRFPEEAAIIAQAQSAFAQREQEMDSYDPQPAGEKPQIRQEVE